MDPNQFDLDDDGPTEVKKVLKEFECPACDAHNPVDDGFSDGDEVLCCYCGCEFKVQMRDGRVKLKET